MDDQISLIKEPALVQADEAKTVVNELSAVLRKHGYSLQAENGFMSLGKLIAPNKAIAMARLLLILPDRAMVAYENWAGRPAETKLTH